MKAGAIHFVQKPFDPEELLELSVNVVDDGGIHFAAFESSTAMSAIVTENEKQL